MRIKTKRIYEPYATSDGYRVLTDRLWPRGIKKEGAHINVWMKDVGPSTELRKWFNHEPEKWTQFVKRYQSELKKSLAFKELISLTNSHKTITLLYGTKDEQHNHALVLKNLLNKSI
jgi:uncharacterized protein YeaO (DUF488 family)